MYPDEKVANGLEPFRQFVHDLSPTGTTDKAWRSRMVGRVQYPLHMLWKSRMAQNILQFIDEDMAADAGDTAILASRVLSK